jgi:hypothetical protein
MSRHPIVIYVFTYRVKFQQVECFLVVTQPCMMAGRRNHLKVSNTSSPTSP